MIIHESASVPVRLAYVFQEFRTPFFADVILLVEHLHERIGAEKKGGKARDDGETLWRDTLSQWLEEA